MAKIPTVTPNNESMVLVKLDFSASIAKRKLSQISLNTIKFQYYLKQFDNINRIWLNSY